MTKMKKSGKAGKVAAKSGKVTAIEAAESLAAAPAPAPAPTAEKRGRGRPVGTHNKVYPEMETLSNTIKTERHEAQFLRCKVKPENLAAFDVELSRLANTSRAIVGRYRSLLTARDELAAAETAYAEAEMERKAIMDGLRSLS